MSNYTNSKREPSLTLKEAQDQIHQHYEVDLEKKAKIRKQKAIKYASSLAVSLTTFGFYDYLWEMAEASDAYGAILSMSPPENIFYGVVYFFIQVVTLAAGIVAGFSLMKLFGLYKEAKEDRVAAEVGSEIVGRLVRKAYEGVEDEDDEVLDNPEAVYSYLKDIRDKFPLGSEASVNELHRKTNTVLSQLDAMNDLQDRLEELFRVNDIQGLVDCRELLQDIEDAICLVSTRGLINYYIVGLDELYGKHIDATISDNNQLLGQTQLVLYELVEFVNGSTSLDEIKAKIAAFHDHIRGYINKEASAEFKMEMPKDVTAAADHKMAVQEG